jgi:hypothetical protein
MVLDSNNFPHIAYSDSATNQIKYVRIVCQFIFCGWSTEVVDTGLMPAVRRSADGKVHVAYFAGGAVRYAVRGCTGSSCSGTWSLQIVGQTGGSIAFFPGLALDSAGGPHIVFVRNPFGAGELVYARRWRFGWNLEVADVDISTTANTSIALDANNVRHVSAPGASDQSIRHLKGTPQPPVIFELEQSP